MDLLRLKESDQFGRFYLKVPGNTPIENYFKSLDALRPFLNSDGWQDAVTGYFINLAGDRDAVRLSYFSAEPGKALDAIKDLLSQGSLVEAGQAEAPFSATVSDLYGREELRFRRFLTLYTAIGLDIMKADLLNARSLVATFRWQVMLARRPIRSHFEKTFRAQSPSFNALSDAQKEKLWSDLSYWPNPLQVDWAHMMVNMILPGDWSRDEEWDYFFSPKPAKTIPEINEKLKDFGFQIPKNWYP